MRRTDSEQVPGDVGPVAAGAGALTFPPLAQIPYWEHLLELVRQGLPLAEHSDAMARPSQGRMLTSPLGWRVIVSFFNAGPP